MQQIETLKELVEWAWQSRKTLMKKYKYSNDQIVFRMPPQMWGKLMQWAHESVYGNSNGVTLDNANVANADLNARISGIVIETTADYRQNTCAVEVRDKRPSYSFDIVGDNVKCKQNPTPETFTVDITKLLSN